MIKLLFLSTMCICFGGCWWGAIFDGDMTVKVKNHTDEKIRVVPVGSLYGDDMYNGQRQDIKSGRSSIFHYDGFEIDPKIEVKYRDQKRIYDVDIDFWGYDEVNVEKYHFVNGNG